MCYARRQRSSWARIKLSKSLYQNSISRLRSNLTSSIALSFFYFCWVVFSSVRISEIRFKLVRFVLLSCCSIFKDQCLSAASALASTFLLYHLPPGLSIPFLKVFSTFFGFFVRKGLYFPVCSVARSTRSRGELVYYTIPTPLLSSSFFKKIWNCWFFQQKG